MSTRDFYSVLPVHPDFSDVTRSEAYALVPGDWTILIADVAGSTEAVASGRYKEVNFVGASCIVSVLNALRSENIEIPFVFGGDGATLLVPPTSVEAAWSALEATRQMAEREYGLALRIGAVEVGKVTEAGRTLKVAKVRISPHFSQAMFVGGGLSHAEKIVKARPDLYQRPCKQAVADFSGLECRWQEIPAERGETQSWLILATGSGQTENSEIYRAFLQELQRVYGDSGLNPVSARALRLSLNPNRLGVEIRAHNPGLSWWGRLGLHLRMLIVVLIGKVLFLWGGKTTETDWGRYRGEVEENTDYRKFDDMMRMVLSGTPTMRAALEGYLEENYRKRKLVYGLHVGTHAQMTCLVFSRQNQHIHFVDGSGGGYTLAAKALKERLKVLGF